MFTFPAARIQYHHVPDLPVADGEPERSKQLHLRTDTALPFCDRRQRPPGARGRARFYQRNWYVPTSIVSIHAPELYLTSIKAAAACLQSNGPSTNSYEWCASPTDYTASHSSRYERFLGGVATGVVCERQDEWCIQLPAFNTWSSVNIETTTSPKSCSRRLPRLL